MRTGSTVFELCATKHTPTSPLSFTSTRKLTCPVWTSRMARWDCFLLAFPFLTALTFSVLFLLQVEGSKLGVLANWRNNYTLETVLSELRKWEGSFFFWVEFGEWKVWCFIIIREMASSTNKKLPQPPEGSNFWVARWKKRRRYSEKKQGQRTCDRDLVKKKKKEKQKERRK